MALVTNMRYDENFSIDCLFQNIFVYEGIQYILQCISIGNYIVAQQI